jgi:hypothetical protein
LRKVFLRCGIKSRESRECLTSRLRCLIHCPFFDREECLRSDERHESGGMLLMRDRSGHIYYVARSLLPSSVGMSA